MMLPHCARLTFRTWTTADEALAASLWQNEEVMRFIGGPYTNAQVRERLEREIEHERRYGFQYWPLFERETFAGVCGLKPHKIESNELELGFHLMPAFWGRGHASEAARAVMEHAFNVLHATALYAGHHPNNEASRRVVEKLGFECIGTHFFAPTGLDHPWYKSSQNANGSRVTTSPFRKATGSENSGPS